MTVPVLLQVLSGDYSCYPLLQALFRSQRFFSRMAPSGARPTRFELWSECTGATLSTMSTSGRPHVQTHQGIDSITTFRSKF